MKTLQRIVGLAGAALVVAACSGGSGPLVTTLAGGRDDPGTTRDVPPSTSDNSGGDCIVCDVTYDCPNAGNLGNGVSLSTTDGTCTAALKNVICSGALFGTGPCSGGGGGAFTCGSITCTPAQSVPVGGSGGVGTPGSGFADAG